ncbi:MAG: GspE/PulE family protein [Fretibacterium sp.]|nr:GspE/PulE family protein [Fretibacterium sp.]
MDALQNNKGCRLGEILLRTGAVCQEQLDYALSVQSQKGRSARLGEILLSMGMISENCLAEALSVQLGLPFYSLSQYYAEPEAIQQVPHAVAKRLNLVPLFHIDEKNLFVVMADPLDLTARDEVGALTGCGLRIGIAAKKDIQDNLDRLYSLHDKLEGAIPDTSKEREGIPWKQENIPPFTDSDAPIIEFVNRLIRQAVSEGASDIHLEVQEGGGCARFRVDGLLSTVFDYPSSFHHALVSRLKVMANMDIAERRKPQDGRIWIAADGRHIDLRISTLLTINGEKAVLRILDKERALRGLDSLGLGTDDRNKLEMFCSAPWGILLVTGPTGSGKSTSLYALLQKLNRPDINIVTVEDPVEYAISGLNQVQVNEKAGLTFESALRSILRQDPDKIMVGEIRDRETAQIAVRAALTGHFVISTLHTNDAPSAVTRMIDMGIPPFLVSASLMGVVAQRLVRLLCPLCREEYELDPRTCDMAGVPRGTRAFRPRGCSKCRNGYRGRSGIFEIMVIDEGLRRIILDGAGETALRQAALRQGMRTLRQSGINAVLTGSTSMEEVLSATL